MWMNIVYLWAGLSFGCGRLGLTLDSFDGLLSTNSLRMKNIDVISKADRCPVRCHPGFKVEVQTNFKTLTIWRPHLIQDAVLLEANAVIWDEENIDL